MLQMVCCNLFLGPHTKKKKIQKNQKYMFQKNPKNNNSEKRISKRPEND